MTKPPVLTCLVNLSADQAVFQNLTVTGYLLYRFFLPHSINSSLWGGGAGPLPGIVLFHALAH